MSFSIRFSIDSDKLDHSNTPDNFGSSSPISRNDLNSSYNDIDIIDIDIQKCLGIVIEKNGINKKNNISDLDASEFFGSFENGPTPNNKAGYEFVDGDYRVHISIAAGNDNEMQDPNTTRMELHVLVYHYTENAFWSLCGENKLEIYNEKVNEYEFENIKYAKIEKNSIFEIQICVDLEMKHKTYGEIRIFPYLSKITLNYNH